MNKTAGKKKIPIKLDVSLDYIPNMLKSVAPPQKKQKSIAFNRFIVNYLAPRFLTPFSSLLVPCFEPVQCSPRAGDSDRNNAPETETRAYCYSQSNPMNRALTSLSKTGHFHAVPPPDGHGGRPAPPTRASSVSRAGSDVEKRSSRETNEAAAHRSAAG